MSNPTALAFGYPHTLVGETGSWLILARPKQSTFGALVLICKEEAHAFSEISRDAFADLAVVIAAVEAMLRKVVGYEKINYLVLMMVDRDVHFHVLPRYADERVHEGQAFPDAGWPAAPNLGAFVDLGTEGAAKLAAFLRTEWRPA